MHFCRSENVDLNHIIYGEKMLQFLAMIQLCIFIAGWKMQLQCIENVSDKQWARLI